MKIFEISIFGLTIAPTYYALMYILGFIAAWFFMKKFFTFKNPKDLDDLFFLIGLGVILGGRLGYVIFYNLPYYLENFWKIFAIWEGGMSFHGGLIGVLLATLYFAKTRKYSFWNLIDHLAVITPIGLGLGRIGNYLNNELYGYADYIGPFAMRVGDNYHFPSPLLEMFLEGILLFLILAFLFFYKNFYKKTAKLSAIFLIGYGLSRIFVEFFRLPDANIGYLFGTNFITMGMIYSLPMVLFGLYLYKKY